MRKSQSLAYLGKILISAIDLVCESCQMRTNKAHIAVIETQTNTYTTFVSLFT